MEHLLERRGGGEKKQQNIILRKALNIPRAVLSCCIGWAITPASLLEPFTIGIKERRRKKKRPPPRCNWTPCIIASKTASKRRDIYINIIYRWAKQFFESVFWWWTRVPLPMTCTIFFFSKQKLYIFLYIYISIPSVYMIAIILLL